MFDVGDTYPAAVEIRDKPEADGGVLINATTIALTITLPDGTTAAPGITNPPASTGKYTYDYVTTQSGRHVARWVATGPAAAFTEAFDVRPAQSKSLLSLADAKAQLNMSKTVSDEELRLFLEAVTDTIEQIVGPVVRRTTSETRTVCGRALALDSVPVISLTSVTAVTSDSPAVAVADLAVDKDTGIVRRSDGGWLGSGVYDITYTVGRAEVPASIALAARLLTQHMWATQRGATAVSGLGGDEASPPSPGYGLDVVPNRVRTLLAPYALPPAVC